MVACCHLHNELLTKPGTVELFRIQNCLNCATSLALLHCLSSAIPSVDCLIMLSKHRSIGSNTSTVLLAPGSHAATLPSCRTTAHLKSVMPGDNSTCRLQLSPSDHSIAVHHETKSCNALLPNKPKPCSHVNSNVMQRVSVWNVLQIGQQCSCCDASWLEALCQSMH